jgi:monoamine oxidase
VRLACESPRGVRLPELRARACVVALPLGVLQSGDVAFDPPLPNAHRDALGKLAFGSVVKAVLRLNPELMQRAVPGIDPATPLAQVGFLNGDELAFPTWWPLRPLVANVMTGWAAGPAADALENLDEPAMLTRAIESLATLISVSPDELDARLEGAFVIDWRRERFSRGAYSWARVGGAEAPRILSAPIADTLVLSGEAVNVNGHGATVHGALESGRAAARAVLAFFG